MRLYSRQIECLGGAREGTVTQISLLEWYEFLFQIQSEKNWFHLASWEKCSSLQDSPPTPHTCLCHVWWCLPRGVHDWLLAHEVYHPRLYLCRFVWCGITLHPEAHSNHWKHLFNSWQTPCVPRPQQMNGWIRWVPTMCGFFIMTES